MTLVANARMYALNEALAAHWRELLGWIAERAGVSLRVVEHAAPAPLVDLWSRSDLGAAAMCGFPLATWRGPSPPVPLAAPVPSPPLFGRRAVYWTDIVVRAGSRFERDDDLAGARFGFTAEDSQSGYHAPRRHFALRALARGGAFFGSTVGPLVTPRRIVDAILDGAIDAGPVDAYWHALLRHHEPRTAARLRVVATTSPTPIPCFVASASIAAAVRRRLAEAFVEAGGARTLRATLAALDVDRFERIDAAAYDALAVAARETDALGYTRLA